MAIGGATATQYIDNSVLDVFDIGLGGWTKIATAGDTIGSRVNHCAVRASADVNGTESHQIFVYGGQQLNQSNRDSAMYILTIPSYTWTFVGANLPGQPSGRAGHQCAAQGSQMIVMGGIVSANVICDQPVSPNRDLVSAEVVPNFYFCQGIYVYDLSKTAWQSSYTAGTSYSVPAIVANLTGASSTAPTSPKPASSGTASSSNTTSASDPAAVTSSSHSNIGAIVGGVVGGLAGVLLSLLALTLLLRKRRRARRVDPAAVNKDKRAARRSNSDSSDGVTGFGHEKSS